MNSNGYQIVGARLYRSWFIYPADCLCHIWKSFIERIFRGSGRSCSWKRSWGSGRAFDFSQGWSIDCHIIGYAWNHIGVQF